MISLVIASIKPQQFAAVEAMYAAAIGSEPFEIIGIHDATSLAEAYNRGFASSRGEIVIFSHDDVEILSPDFVARLKSHLSQYDIVGIAGTNRLYNARWLYAGPPYIFGQVAHPHREAGYMVEIYGAPRPAVGNMQSVDGVWTAIRRSVFDVVRFDPVTYDGLHGHDADFCFAAYRRGLKLAVACDINLLHASSGDFGKSWGDYAERFQIKWLAGVPIPVPGRFQWSAVHVDTRAQALEVMTPPHWQMV